VTHREQHIHTKRAGGDDHQTRGQATQSRRDTTTTAAAGQLVALGRREHTHTRLYGWVRWATPGRPGTLHCTAQHARYNDPPPPHTHTHKPSPRRSRQVLAVSHAVHSHPSIHARSLTHARRPPSRSDRPLVSGHRATPARLESRAFRHQTAAVQSSSPVRGFATPWTHFLHQIWPGSVENLRGRPLET